MTAAVDAIPLAGWRRSVAELYAAVRESDDHIRAWDSLITGRNTLFKEHSQTPLGAKQRAAFKSLLYFPYDRNLRLMGRVNYEVEPEIFRVELEDDGLFQYKRVASLHFWLAGRPHTLSLFWVIGYGGGLFLPFKDATSGRETYGGGRYLYDTIKGADLGAHWETILLDFNFAYNPSCAYNGRYSCPLAPQENHLAVAVEAGEKKFETAN